VSASTNCFTRRLTSRSSCDKPPAARSRLTLCKWNPPANLGRSISQHGLPNQVRQWRHGNSFSRRVFVRSRGLLHGKKKDLPQKEGRRSADRHIHSLSAPHIRMLPSGCASGAEARHTLRCCHLKVLRARSPLGAPLAALAAQINATAQPRPRFARNTMRRRYLRLDSRLQRCTSRAGHSAGRSMPRAARERSANPPAGTALAPRSGVPREHVPWMSEVVTM
jgi:hypothetical protein